MEINEYHLFHHSLIEQKYERVQRSIVIILSQEWQECTKTQVWFFLAFLSMKINKSSEDRSGKNPL